MSDIWIRFHSAASTELEAAARRHAERSPLATLASQVQATWQASALDYAIMQVHHLGWQLHPGG